MSAKNDQKKYINFYYDYFIKTNFIYWNVYMEKNKNWKSYVVLEYYWNGNDGQCSLDPKDLPAKVLDRLLAQSCGKDLMAV